MDENTSSNWLWRILDFINPLRDPSLTVAAVLTFVEEAGQPDTWYSIILIALVNWLAVRGVVWLAVNSTFASVFVGRRLWWAIQHPRLAWRLLDAIGHEEIIIGTNMASLSENIVLQDGMALMNPALGATGIHIIGELPAGTELPMLSMPGMASSQQNGGQFPPGFFPPAAAFNNYNGQNNNNFSPPNNTDEMLRTFSKQPSKEEERLQEQVEAISHILDEWMQYTEEKWRTVSDSQLGWKALHGRWSDWDDIFQDVYAAKTSDPMAEAAQLAGDATARRFETSKDKGSAASAVACFMRDMLTLRRGLEMILSPSERNTGTYSTQQLGGKPSRTPRFRDDAASSPLKSVPSGQKPRNTLIRRPAPIFVDADTPKK